ncbi:CD276 antigen-like [Pempheris klunzingeri]|uniref:CD276 antigen-like n=1 Tax=Pempheris klunzingeri TaxID=3127111 RepID=UPI00397EC01B
MNTWRVKCVVFAVVLTFLPNCAGGDAEVSCVFMESCMLLCSFQAGDDPVVHWRFGRKGDTYVHSYYHSKDQLGGQDQHFTNRTLMFRDQISRGNASLQLMRVEVQDQGRYRCYTSTIRGNKESFIDLTVDAPVSKVDIQQEGNWITCRSEGIYPEPKLTWSTIPPSTVTLNTLTTNQTEQQLYNISSSLMLSDKVTDLVYSCTVSTRSSRKRNTFNTTKQEPPVDEETPGSKGTVIISVVAVSLFVVILAVAVFCVCKRKNGGRQEQQRDAQVNQQELETLSYSVSSYQKESVEVCFSSTSPKRAPETSTRRIHCKRHRKRGSVGKSRRMIVVCLLTLSVLWPVTEGDAEVSCVFMESCMLPCSFQGGDESVVHWIYGTQGKTFVHSYYGSKDQLGGQDQHFRGRTLMFRDQISRGNASLQLMRVEVLDQGRYKCYTRTSNGNKDSFINLKVDAPVSKVDIQQEGNWITCRSEGIYPKPELTWSTIPPSTVTLNTTTSLQRTEQQLYSISSSLMLSDKVNDLVYSCTVSTRSSRKRNTFNTTKQESPVDAAAPGSEGALILVVAFSLVAIVAPILSGC